MTHAMREPGRLDREIADLELPRSRARVSAHARCGIPSPWPDIACPNARPMPSGSRAVFNVSSASSRRESRRQARTTRMPRSVARRVYFAAASTGTSAVHAHWALACIARVNALPDVAKALEARLTQVSLEKEVDWLLTQQTSEWPYGAA